MKGALTTEKKKAAPTLGWALAHRPASDQTWDDGVLSKEQSSRHAGMQSDNSNSHDFGRIPVHPPGLATDNQSLQPTTQSCPLALASPRACPFGGACHTCPVRVQAKLAISQPGDEYEQEADRVAEQVMRMPDTPHREVPLVSARSATPAVQRTSAPDKEKEEEEEEILQREESSGCTGTKADSLSDVPPIVHEVLQSPGQPLDPATCAFFEPRFGHDFSRVRVHTDTHAAASARAVNALAYTIGKDVVFSAGQYEPRMSQRPRLLAHELTHVVQQTSGQAARQHKRAGNVSSAILEHAANRAAKNSADGKDVGIRITAPISIQREAPPETPSCGTPDLFTELDLPWPIPDNYFRGNDWKEKANWKKELEAARRGKCEAKGQFKNVKVSWDLGNPALGSYYGMNLNKNSIAFDINPYVVYSGKPCGACFTGTANWSFNVDVTRKKGTKTETGRTKAPITGSITGEKCDGKTSCAVNQALDIGLSLGDSEVSAAINGKVTITGAVFSG